MAKHKIALVTSELLTPGKDLVYSGGDRYARDMVHLLHDLGFAPTIFQRSKDGEVLDTKWEGARVIGLPSKRVDSFNTDVTQNTQEYRATIYFNMLLAFPRVHRRSVAISHGIWFDHVDMPPAADDRWDKFRQHLQAVVSNLERVVSVDTNTINFFGALFAGRYHPKFTHIPNAVDLDMYKPVDRSGRKTCKVLYPRRMEILRGITEMQRVAEELAPRYKQVEFHFCGHCHTDSMTEHMTTWTERNPRTYWYAKTFDEMPSVYQEADIAVVPTIGCEGTSLSLIEAMASGLPVVSTYVGGLSELVIDGFNGLKVAPVLDEIRDAVDYLIRKPTERERMGRNARAVAERFGKDKWRRQWGDLLRDLVR